MKELLGDEYYVDLFDEIAASEPITEAVDEVVLPCRPAPHSTPVCAVLCCAANVHENHSRTFDRMYIFSLIAAASRKTSVFH